MTIHWTVRIISVLGIIVTLALYVGATRATNRGGPAVDPAAVPAPTPSATTPWQPPVSYAASTARAAFLGTLDQVIGKIPRPARAAYDRAALVMADADPGCHLDWVLLAGVGWVETQHGRRGGSSLDRFGTMRIPLYGPALSGVDTDAGEFDERDDIDRPVGPLQFMPHLWAAVGVDADGDGRRDAQDVNDAALALAVFLCGGKGNLADGLDATARLEQFNTVEGYATAVRRAAAYYRRTAPAIDDLAPASPTAMTIVEDPLDQPSESPAVSASASSSTSPRPTRKPSPTAAPSTAPTSRAPRPTPSAAPDPSMTTSTTASASPSPDQTQVG